MATRAAKLVIEGDVARAWTGKMRPFQTLPKTRVVQAVQIPHDFIMVQDGDVAITGKLHCKAGCWLVRTSQGNLYPVPSDVFGSQYEEVVEHEPIAGVTRV